MKNGWNDKRSCIDTDKSDGSKIIKAWGQYWHNDIQFNYCLTRQKAGEYIMRGQCSIISPADGTILQVQGKERRKRLKKCQDIDGKHKIKALNTTSAIYTKTDDINNIKEIIAKKAEMMYGLFYLEIYNALNNTAKTQNLHTAQAVRLFGEKFIKSCRCISTKTAKSYLSILIRIGAALDHRYIGDVSQADIKHMLDKMGKGAKSKIRLAKRFWDYCRDNGLYRGDNPIEIYLNNAPKDRKSDETLQRAALVCKSLPFKVEIAMNNHIKDNLHDGRNMGLALIKGAGLHASVACAIKWGDLIFDDEDYKYVRVRVQKDDLTGATHDYTHPIFPTDADNLHKKYDLLSQKYMPNVLNKMYVVTYKGSDKKPMSPKDLTAYCRSELLLCGIGYAALTKTKGDEPGGVGIRLLIDNYKHKLINECGLISDKASVLYLSCQSLSHDVTADHYRSFSSPEGQVRLYRLMRRDRRFETKSTGAEPIIRNVQNDGSEVITINSEDPQRLLGISIRLIMKKDEEINISSPCGVRGVISVRAIKPNGNKIKKKCTKEG